MADQTYKVILPDKGVPIKAWTKGVPLEEAAQKQLLNVTSLPFIYKWVAAMPDVHWGSGAKQDQSVVNLPVLSKLNCAIFESLATWI